MSTTGGTLRADLVKGFLEIASAAPGEKASLQTEAIKVDRDHTYLEQLKAVLHGPHADLCTFEQGLATVRLIEETEARNLNLKIS